MTERVTDAKLHVLAAYRYLADGTKIGVTNEYGDGYEYLGSLIYRHTPSGLELESTDFSGGRLDRTTAGYAVKYFVRDYLGSVRAIADERGQRIESMDYLPFGSRWSDPTRLVTDNRYLYNGKEWQPTGDLNVLDYGARHYDPTLGRWFNPDPAMQFLNPYTFCGNDPINLMDKNGLWIETDDGFFTDNPKEIGIWLAVWSAAFSNREEEPEITVTVDDNQIGDNKQGGGPSPGSGIMVNGTIYSGYNEYANYSYLYSLLRYYQFQKGKSIYMPEKC